ncbi:hypothetical protein, partial [Sulfurimonas sp. NWX79]
MHRRKSYQKVSSNIQRIDGNNNNQAGRDINHNNFLGSLKVNPQDVEVDAIINYSRLLSFAFVAGAMLITLIIIKIPPGKQIPGLLEMYFFITMMAFVMMPIFMSFFTLESVLKFLSYFLNLKVRYKDGILEYGKIKRKFYSEIWDIKYKKSFFGSSAILTIYAMNEKKKIPYKDIIRFKDDAKAKYIYD